MVRRSLVVPPGVSLTEDEPRDALGPVGVTVTDTLTVPLNPFRLESASVTIPDVVRGTVIDDALAASEKSGESLTLTRRVVEWEREVEFPLMVTV